MIVQISDDFDLEKIADSGQCFRWVRADGQTWRIIAGKQCLYVTETGNDLYELDCSKEAYSHFWHGYFDLGENYSRIREKIDPEKDPFLWKAAEKEKGIRILRQDPWEMLISFIISQNKNIPAIRRCIELLAARCGERMTDSKGLSYFGFPGPEAIAALSEEDLMACRLGYRWKYVLSAARAVLAGDIDLNELVTADEKTAMTALTGLFGVGVKVASCVALFGLHHTDAFPVDVWVRRVLADQYPGGYPYERYAPYNGVFQQYMFAFYRQNEGVSRG